MAFGTMVQNGSGSFQAIETYSVGDQAMAAGTALNWSAKSVVFSGGTSKVSRQPFTVLVVYGDTVIAVTSDHLFLLGNGELRRADRLTPQDTLMSPQGQPVPVKAVHIGDYLAGFHYIATSNFLEPPSPGLEDHLLNTNGVVSADYAVQLWARSGDVPNFRADENTTLPVVGSPEYIKKYGPGSLRSSESSCQLHGPYQGECCRYT
jgi:hypothetical protein